MQTTDQDRLPHRQFTCRHKTDGSQDSRLDDILTSDFPNTSAKPMTRVLDTRGDADHDPVLAYVPLTSIKFVKPGPDPTPLPREARMKTPVAQQDLDRFKEEHELVTAESTVNLINGLDETLELAFDIQRMTEPRQSVKDALAAEGIGAETVERYDTELQQIMKYNLAVAEETPPFTQAGALNKYRCRTRCTNRKLEALAHLRQALHETIRENRDCKPRDEETCQHMQNFAEDKIDALLLSQRVGFPKPPADTEKNSWKEWEQECGKARKTAQKTKQKKTKKLKQESSNAVRQRIQKQYPIKQKQMNKQIFGNLEDRKQLTTVLNKETGKMVTDPVEVTTYVQDSFQKQARPASGLPKTNDFYPNSSNREYPWKVGAHSNIDPFTLETAAGKQEYGHMSMVDHMRDPNLFSDRIKRLKNGKSPGPDGIPNELLKHLPEGIHQAIHKLFILMWLTGSTPKAWKESRTVLLYKKGSEHDLSNWRPIALANTLYKLWTGMIAECLSRHADHYNILSSSQEGFRKHKNTIRQLRNLMNVMSDARISHQDLYILYVDFSSAFNTIDHDKLLCIMHDLGFPADAIHVIADLYTDAVTKIRLYFAETDRVEIERGTIQGDTLSPLLFLIFIEPLLRWLQSGGRGYQYGCLSKTVHASHTNSSNAYADDLAAITSTIANLKTQALKIEAFTSWSGMTMNCKKCAVTGVLWGQAQHNGSDNVLSQRMVKMTENRARQVMMQNTPIPFLHPHTQPYRYLGVDITPTFNWAPHIDRVLTEAKQKGEKLLMSALSIKQKRLALNTVIDSFIKYSFPTGCMSLTDVNKFDIIRTRICKKIHRIPQSTPSAMILDDHECAGLGLTSLAVQYAELTCKYLTKALNDKGALGFTTRAMLTLQNGVIDETLNHAPSRRYLRQTSHYHLARKLAILQTSDLELAVPEGHNDLCGNALSKTISLVQYDPCDLGIACKIPPEVFKPLLDICTNFRELCLPNKRKVIFLSTLELARKFGKTITNKHKLALNQLTKIVNRNHLSSDDIIEPSFNHIAPLCIEDRILRNPDILKELQGPNTQQVHSQEINEIECRALALLQQHQHEHREEQLRLNRSRRKQNVRKPRRCNQSTQETDPEGSENAAPTSQRRCSATQDTSGAAQPTFRQCTTKQGTKRNADNMSGKSPVHTQRKAEAKLSMQLCRAHAARVEVEKKRKRYNETQKTSEASENDQVTTYTARKTLDSGAFDGSNLYKEYRAGVILVDGKATRKKSKKANNASKLCGQLQQEHDQAEPETNSDKCNQLQVSHAQWIST